MATVLEELLIKVGFDVDQKGLEKTRDSIRDDLQATGKETNANKKRNKSLKDQKNQLEDINDEKEKGEKENKKKDQEEEKRIGRGKQANKILNDAKGLLGGVSKGWVAAGVAAAAYTVKMAQINDDNAKLSRSLGVNIDELESMQFAAKKNGASAESLNQTIQSLTSIIGASELGEYNQGLSMMGINTRNTNGELKDSIELLWDISEAIKGMPKAKQLQMISMSGVSPDLLHMMQEGRHRMKALVFESKELGNSSKQARDNAEDLGDAWTETGKAFNKSSEEGVNMMSAFGIIAAKSATGLFSDGRGLKDRLSDPQGIYNPFGLYKDVKGIATGAYEGATTVIENMNIEVNGAGDPKSIADEIDRRSAEQIRKAANNANKSGSQ